MLNKDLEFHAQDGRVRVAGHRQRRERLDDAEGHGEARPPRVSLFTLFPSPISAFRK